LQPTALAGFVALQFIRPDLPNPPVVAGLQAPAPVKQILQGSCYHCHSNETHLAWFDQVVPGYWLVVSDVKDARQHLNSSNFGNLPAARQKAYLYEALNQARLGAMSTLFGKILRSRTLGPVPMLLIHRERFSLW
jgi:hypothetical protein